MPLTTAKWTLEDYHRMIDAGILAGRQVELLNGEIVEMSPEGAPHANRSTKAANYLRRLLGEQVEIREGKPITLPDNSEPEPDIAVVQPLNEDYEEHHPYPGNIFLLIEFANSSLKKDLEEKTTIYAAAGIQDYWVVNLRAMQLMVFRTPGDARYLSETTLTQGDVTPLAFPDVVVSVQRLLGRE
jgi:Uma2 family endonuclease